MLGYLMVGTNNLDRALEFYDAVLAPLGLQRRETAEAYAGYAADDAGAHAEFYVTRPYDGGAATVGNGTMIALMAPSVEAVAAFHATGLAAGGADEGAPGPREGGGDICYAYLRDPDGNKICAFAEPVSD